LRLRVLLNTVKVWPVCLAGATIAYLTLTGLLFLLTPDIAVFMVERYVTIRLALAMVATFLFLNLLLTLTYSVSLFIIRHESILESLRKNGRSLLKGFMVLSLSSFASLALIVSASLLTVSTTTLGMVETLGLFALNYGAGAVASILFAASITRLVASLAGESFRIGLKRFLAVTIIAFLMLTILSAYRLPGLFICSLLIPTAVSIATRSDGAGEPRTKTRFSWFKGRGVWKATIAMVLSILILNAETPLGPMLLVLGEKTMFNEDRLKKLVSKAVAEGWSSGELADAIKNDPELSMLSNYDLSGATIERDDRGRVVVIIPLTAMGYNISRKTRKKTTVYDVYLQSGSGEAVIGDRRYVPKSTKIEEKTYGPFETLDEALAKEAEVKGLANSTRIIWNTTMKTESRVVTEIELRYAIVPTVVEIKYNVIAEYDNYQSACTHGAVIAGAAKVRTVEKQVWVESYKLEFVKETTSQYEAMKMKEYGYVVEEVKEVLTILIFEMYAPNSIGSPYLGTREIEKKEFEKMLQTGELAKGVDSSGKEYYYYSSGGASSIRLYKKGERQEEGDTVVGWRIYKKIDTSHYETKKVYQVVTQAGCEEKKISVGELPSYAKGFEYKEDAENSKPMVEPELKKWVEQKGLAYKSCQVESYEEVVNKLETVTKEVKQYYVAATHLKTVYDVYELKPYYRACEETHFEEKYGWVFKGYVDEKPENYDMVTWVYTPEVSNWTSKVYLGLVTGWEAQVLTSTDPRYVAEKHNTTTVTREIVYYDVYNATWRLLYHHYKYFVYPFHEYLANGNVSSSENWVFESIGEASGEICDSTHLSSPSSLRITTGSGRGAWRQSFYFDAGGASPTIEFWYMLRGSGALAIKKPDGSAHLFTLGESNGWSRFLRNSTDIFTEVGYYTVSFVACEDSELFVDDASIHVGGYGEWIYQGDVEECPSEAPPDEKYEPFYRIEDKKLIGTFEGSIASQYPTPPYIKEFKKSEKVSYVVDFYRLYYLEDGLVRYRVYHWEKYTVPVAVRREERGASWVLVESGVEASVGSRILVESNVPENIVREKYSDPLKYYLVPKVIDGEEGLETVCLTLDRSLAEKYENEGYVVNETKISVGSPIRFEAKILEATVEKNELSMLGKQNTLKLTVANPTDDTLTCQVVLETTNEKHVEEVQRYDIPASAPGAVEKIYSYPVAEPGSWLITIPPGGAPYEFPFTVWVRREYEGSSVRSEDTTYWPGGAVDCSFLIKVLRNGRLVAKYSTLDTFQNYDLGKVIARHPFETVAGFLVGAATTACITVLSILAPPVSIGLAVFSLGLSTANAIGVYKQTGSLVEALTYSPLGIVLAPLRAFLDPTMDDAARCSIIGALIGTIVGQWVGEKIALDVAMLRMPEAPRNNPAIYSRLHDVEKNMGTPLASSTAVSIGKLYPYFDTLDDPEGLVAMILSDMMKSREDALYIAGVLEWASSMGDEFLSRHAGDIMEWLGSPLLRGKLSPLLQLSPEEALQLSQNLGGDFLQMLRMAEFKLALEQLKLQGPDAVRLFSWSSEGIEVGVEKGLAGQLYPSIQKGTVVEFEFARGSIVLKGFLTYVDDRVLDVGEYLIFSLKAEEYSSAVFELLREDLQVVPGQMPQKAFGFNAFSLSNGKLTLDKGSLSVDGSVRFCDGMVLKMDEPEVMLVPSDNPLETGTLNEMLLQGRISGTSVVVDENGVVKAFQEGTYLSAVVTASTLGLQLGLLAKPSGGALTIPGESLRARGILDPSLVHVVYPDGAAVTTLYKGGSLQIPLHSYFSGAFVGIQAVETSIVWTEAIGRREFYAQVASVSELLGSVLGRVFAEQLVETVLQSGLTDAQALDVVNTLVRNVEWLKTLTGSGRVEAVRRITDYVRKGDTAEEAREKVERESDEYVKNLWIQINSFLQNIGDPELAGKIVRLLECVSGNLVDEPNATSWLLGFLASIRAEGGNAKLRSVVENLFKYSESVTQGCAVASRVIRELMRLDQKKLLSLLGETSWTQGWTSFVVSVGENRYINFGRVETAKATLLRIIAGGNEFIMIRINGHEVIRKLNPERKGSYQWMMPEFVGDFGEKGSEITVMVRPLSRREFIESVVRSLPFNLRLTLESDDRGMLTLMDAVSFPVRVTRFEWSEGNNALEVDLEFQGTHRGEMVPHTLAIAAKGDEVKAVIRFSDTSGTVNSIRLGTLEGHIVINYHDYSDKDSDHDTLPENVMVLLERRREEKGWPELELSEEEKEMLRELVKANKREEYGNTIRDLVLRKMKNTGEILGRKIKTDKIREERQIYSRDERVDIVAESVDGKLIVVEVKSTKDPENVWEQYRKAWEQLKVKTESGGPGYMQLIEEYGLKVFDEVRRDVEAYMVVVVLIDENTGMPHIEVMKEVPKD